jgi:hypothetical protein
MLGLVRSLFGLGAVASRSPEAETVEHTSEAVSHSEAMGPDSNRAAVAYNELLLAIETAFIAWRPSRQGDETAGPIVRLATIGSWEWSDRLDAKNRIAAKYPELADTDCVRAAKLLEAQIGKRNLQAYRKVRSVDRRDREEELFWKGYNV